MVYGKKERVLSFTEWGSHTVIVNDVYGVGGRRKMYFDYTIYGV